MTPEVTSLDLAAAAALLRDRAVRVGDLAAAGPGDPGRPDPFLKSARILADAARAFVSAAEKARDDTALPPSGETWSHYLRNLLNKIDGPRQNLRRLEQSELHEGLRDDLDEIGRLVGVCLRWLDQLPAAPANGGRPSLAPPQPLTPSATARPPVAAAARAPATEPGVILIVEDDQQAREDLSRALRAMGHRVREAPNGEQALDDISHQPFDMILLDHQLPGLGGLEVLQNLRANARTETVPVLMVSGLSEIDRVVGCLDAGADDFLPKPINHTLLRAKVNAFLQKRRYRVRELEQFFPPEVARQMVDRPDLLRESREEDVTVLFSDIRGFSRLSEKLGPAKTVRWVSAVMEELSQCVLEHGGVLVDFIGDELMAMWGAPARQEDHARQACQAALAMLERLPGLNKEWEPTLKEQICFGVGINSGPAHVGNTGTRRKFKYGPLGHTVNLASRVQGATKYLKANLVVTQATLDGLAGVGGFEYRRLAKTHVVNIEQTVSLYELVPLGRPGWPDLKIQYEKALELFETRQLTEAASVLSGLITEYGPRGPKMALMARTIECIAEPQKWKETYDLPGK